VAERLSLQFKSIDIHDILDLIAINAEFFQPIKLSQNICTDHDDEKFISCALSSNSKLIVTGDKHLLKITGYKGIEIITPKAFIKKYL
jgi:putative PIN family toxin of toxin-antitoxin system